MRRLVRATVVALAMFALVGAAAASASELRAEEYGALLQGSKATHYITTSDHSTAMECDSYLTAGLTEASSTVAATPSYPACNYWGVSPLNTNGCYFQLHFGAELPDGRFKGTVDIGPSECGPMKRATVVCTTTIAAQNGLDAHFENVGEGTGSKVVVDIDAKGLAYSQTGLGCSTGSYEDGSYRGEWEISGNAGGMPTGIAVEEDPHEARFEAPDYPVAASAPASEYKFSFGKGNEGSCSGVLAGELANASTTLGVSPSYSACSFFSLSGSVATNGCTYVYGAGSATGVGEYAGTMDIACPAGKAIEISAGNGQCKLSIPAQTGLATLEFEDVLVEPFEVQADAGVSSMTYSVTKDGIICPLAGTGTFTNGTYSGSSTLEGLEGEGFPSGLYIWGT